MCWHSVQETRHLPQDHISAQVKFPLQLGLREVTAQLHQTRQKMLLWHDLQRQSAQKCLRLQAQRHCGPQS